MAKIGSIFGVYASMLQVVVNKANDRFQPTFYDKYFGWGSMQQSLSFTSVIGASRIEAAASIVSRTASAPLRSRDQVSTYQGEIPAIKEKFGMRESDYRDFMTIQALSTDNEAKKNQLLDILFKDVIKAGDAAHKRLDILALQAVSTGKITLNSTNNPDGVVMKTDLDLLMPATNKTALTGTAKWSASDTATPFADIAKIVADGTTAGKSFEKILMPLVVFNKLKACKEVVASLVSYNQLQQGAGIATLNKINEYLTDNQLPIIEIENNIVGIEKDGKITPYRPFSQTNISFIPSGQLGTIKNAVCIEQLKPVASVSYATYKNALISKWSENDPWGEFTSVELNAFPALEAIDNIYILTVL